MSEELAIAERIAGVFRTIGQTRMAGVPILNAALTVEVVGLRPFGENWFCVLITPWFMNMLLLPRAADDTAWLNLRPGESQRHVLPCGAFSFLVGEEEGLGTYQCCSLFSPVFEFTAQDQAVQTAEAIIAEVMKADVQEPPGQQADTQATSKPDLESPSRRNLLAMARDAIAGDGT